MGSKRDAPPLEAPPGSPERLEARRVEALLPHGEGALLIDYVPWFEPGREAVGVLAPLGDMAGAVPRRSGGAIAPELLIEALAQLAGLLITSIAETPDGPTPAWLAGLRRVRLLAPAPAGCPLTARVRFTRRFGRLIHLEGEVSCGATRCLEGTVLLALGSA